MCPQSMHTLALSSAAARAFRKLLARAGWRPAPMMTASSSRVELQAGQVGMRKTLPEEANSRERESATRPAGMPTGATSLDLLARSLQLPLSTGGAAVSLLTVPIFVCQIIAFAPMFISEVPDWVPRWVGGIVTLVLGVLWAGYFFLVVGAALAAWERRASDITLSPHGMAIRGGPSHRLELPWDGIDPAQCTVSPATLEEPAVLRLSGHTVASSEDAEEARSFAAIAETVQALSRGGTPPQRAARPEVLSCPGCGAAVAPVPGGDTGCRFCGARVVMPPEVKRGFEDLAQLRGARLRIDALLRDLLRQPSARFTNLLLAASVPPLALALPLTSVLFNEMYVTRHIFRGFHALWLFPFAVCFSLGLQLWLRTRVATRAAIRLVSLRYRARPPAAEDGPWACRLCGGPLPEEPDGLLVLCVYCRAENLTGLALREDSDQMEAQAGALEITLRESVARRRRHRLATLAAAALFGLSTAALASAFPRTCRDGMANGQETDQDCGGPCLRCAGGKRCQVNHDCQSKLCIATTCTEPTCGDGVKNGDETDLDCGGSCAKCARGSFCHGSLDCGSERCALSGRCE